MKSSLSLSTLYSRKLTNYLERKLIRQKVVFLHIPKCGGTSIRSAIADSIGAKHKGYVNSLHTKRFAQIKLSREEVEGSEVLLKTRQSIFFDYFSKDVPFIFGHFPIIQDCLIHPKGYIFITVLREPVSRFISQFKYFISTRWPSKKIDITRQNLNDYWKTYIESDLANFHANILSAYLDGNDLSNIGTNESKARAIDNLKHFHVIGFTENLSDFSAKFLEITNNSLDIKRRNVSADKMDSIQKAELDRFFDQSKYKRISDLTSKDRELYEFAKQIMSQS